MNFAASMAMSSRQVPALCETPLPTEAPSLQRLLEDLRQGLCVYDAQRRLVFFNQRYAELYDLHPGTLKVGMGLREVVDLRFAAGTGPNMTPVEYASWRERIAVDQRAVDSTVTLRNGRTIEIYHAPTSDGGWISTHNDVSDQVRAMQRLAASEARLRASEERLARAVDAGDDGLWDWNIVTGDTWFSDRWMTMLGYAPGELAGHVSTWETLVHPDDKGTALERLTAHFEERSPVYECEFRLRKRDGGWGWVLARGKVVSRDRSGRPLQIVGTHIDITVRKAAEAQIAHMARHDALTDLPNRAFFREHLDRRLAEVRRDGSSCALLCLDLDRFKAVNDGLGHLVGDALLREVAHRLRGLLEEDDVAARIGGDEFAILLSRAVSLPDATVVAERLVARFQNPMTVGQHRVDVGLSIGIAFAPAHGSTSEEILKRADLALLRAKTGGRRAAVPFDPTMDRDAQNRRDLEKDLSLALSRNEFVLHYQPQVRAQTGELLGFESLLRWQHPVRGLVGPAVFIPLAEETGLILALGDWVIAAACRAAAGWPQPVKIAVNLSPRQIVQVDLPDRVLAILAETGLAPQRLEFEITESVMINDVARALSVLRRLKAIGATIAMDDFGTGYSSLATLQVFPFDRIKIDRSFVGHVNDSHQAAAIVRAIMALGRSLNISVMAEGVETVDQLRFLMAEGCDEIQGHIVGQPSAVPHFKAELAPRSKRNSTSGARRIAR